MRATICLMLISLVAAVAAQDIIVDNEDVGFSEISGTWTTSGSLIGWPNGSGTYQYETGTGGAATGVCEWRPTIPATGAYEVSVWYYAGANRAKDAPFTVYHANGNITVDVNQEGSGSQWVPIGTFDFNAGTGGYVRLTNAAESGQVVIADAVKFTPDTGSGTVDPSEIRGVWSSRYDWPASSQSGTKSEIDAMMTNLANNNFNTVFFQIRAQCDTLYPSPYEPWSPVWDESDPGWDPVPYAINAAHSQGISLHAYINTHTIWGSQTPPASLDHVYYSHGNPSDPAHRDWLLFDASGTPAGFNEYHYMNPGIPEADAWVRKQIMYVIDTYEVDGVHFDRVRMSAAGYGRNPIAVARWDNPSTGTPNDGPGNPAQLGWDDFMRDCITRAMINITGEGWYHDPSVVVSSAPLGLYSASAYPGYPSGYFYGFPRGQDAKAWMNYGAMDFIVPQIYWPDGGSLPDFSDLYSDWQSAANSAGRGLVPGSHNGLSGQSGVESQALIARAGGALGHNLWHNGTTQYSTWSSAGHPYQNSTTYPEFPWRDTESVIIGRVYAEDGNTPVTDAWINRTGSSWTALSAADGLYAFLRVPPGPYTLTASHPDFGVATGSVTTTAGQAAVVDLVLGHGSSGTDQASGLFLRGN